MLAELAVSGAILLRTDAHVPYSTPLHCSHTFANQSKGNRYWELRSNANCTITARFSGGLLRDCRSNETHHVSQISNWYLPGRSVHNPNSKRGSYPFTRYSDGAGSHIAYAHASAYVFLSKAMLSGQSYIFSQIAILQRMLVNSMISTGPSSLLPSTVTFNWSPN